MNCVKVIPILMIGFLLLINGCSQKITQNTFVGTYRLDHRVGAKSHGIETLVLHANGTYSQTFTPAGKGAVMTNTGKWNYDHSIVWLDEALRVPDPLLDIKQYPVEKRNVGLGVSTFPDISLCYDADSDLYYRKTP